VTGAEAGGNAVAIDARQLRAALEARADPEYSRGSLRIAPTRLDVLGVRTPDLRAVAHDWRRANPDAGEETVRRLADALWAAPSREERALGLEILRQFPVAVAALPARFHATRAADLDDWSLCDLLGAAIVGPWVLADPPRRAEFLYELVAGEGVWRPRLALVATVPITRSGTVAPDLALSLLDRVLGRTEPMIVKAVSWSLRELAKRERRRAGLYLRDRGDSLPALVRREVGNVIRTGRKSGRAD
jgi:3-methyladenine DNA glycosylase AlkD